MKAICYPLFLLISMFFVSVPVFAQDNPDEVRETAYEMPRFPGCEEQEMTLDERKACAHGRLMDYLKDELRYPEEAKKQNVEGHVMVSFVVDKEGNIEDPRILKSLGHGCDEEAMRVVKSMNELEKNWVPGTNENGTPLAVRYKLPIQFRL